MKEKSPPIQHTNCTQIRAQTAPNPGQCFPSLPPQTISSRRERRQKGLCSNSRARERRHWDRNPVSCARIPRVQSPGAQWTACTLYQWDKRASAFSGARMLSLSSINRSYSDLADSLSNTTDAGGLGVKATPRKTGHGSAGRSPRQPSPVVRRPREPALARRQYAARGDITPSPAAWEILPGIGAGCGEAAPAPNLVYMRTSSSWRC